MFSSRKITMTLNSTTPILTRGVCQLFEDLGFGILKEFKLANGRRVDIIAINQNGEFIIVEIKSGLIDYRTDRKWQQYLPFCERFYFAVPIGFPTEMIPKDCGLIVADDFSAVIKRESIFQKINTTRKRIQLIKFGHTASKRLNKCERKDYLRGFKNC